MINSEDYNSCKIKKPTITFFFTLMTPVTVMVWLLLWIHKMKHLQYELDNGKYKYYSVAENKTDLEFSVWFKFIEIHFYILYKHKSQVTHS